MSKIQTWGHRWHFRNCLNDNKAKLINSDLLKQKETKNVKKGKTCKGLQGLIIVIFLEREREPLLSRFTGDPIIRFLRAKKESCFTRR